MAAMLTVGMTGARHCRAAMAPNGQPSTGPTGFAWRNRGMAKEGLVLKPDFDRPAALGGGALPGFSKKHRRLELASADEAGRLARAGEAGASHPCQPLAKMRCHGVNSAPRFP
jgi:hypothetical protein